MISIADKVLSGKRIDQSDGNYLFEKASISYLGVLANYIRETKNGDYTYFNRNFHIEPTNICIYQCKFCAFSRKMNEEGSWEFSIDEIVNKVSAYKGQLITEVHIVGGVHPRRDLHYYGQMLRAIKKTIPEIHIKAFTAVELDYMISKAGMSLREGLLVLKDYGLDSIPGGGAEILDADIRKQLCHEKATADKWLVVHRTAHEVGLKSNATILYGHIEKYHHRISHLDQIRSLQDDTKGFNAFIPLKYRNENNFLSELSEINTMEDLRNYAVTRIYLDNVDHIKSYWPMIGKDIAQLSLSFGVDDMDGTIDDSTKIYSMAGVKQTNKMSAGEITALIKQAKRIPVERDTLYHIIKIY